MKRYKTALIQYLKYSVIGLTCAGLDLGLLNLFLYLFPTNNTVLLTLFNSAAYVAAVLNSYFWNSKFTFNESKTIKQSLAFIFQALVSLVIANLVFISGLWLLGFIPVFSKWVITNMAKLLSMYLSSLASFFFNKYFIFRKKSVMGE